MREYELSDLLVSYEKKGEVKTWADVFTNFRNYFNLSWLVSNALFLSVFLQGQGLDMFTFIFTFYVFRLFLLETIVTQYTPRPK